MTDYRVEGESTLDIAHFAKSTKTMFDQLKKIDDQINKVSKNLDEIGKKKVSPRIDLGGVDELKKSLKDIENKMRVLDTKSVKPKIDIDTGKVVDKLFVLQEDLDRINGTDVKVKVKLNDADVMARLAELELVLQAMDRSEVDIRINTRDVDKGKDSVEGFSQSISDLTDTLGAGGGGGGLAGLLGGLSTALVPLGTDLVGLTAGIGSSLATAGLGIGSFAAFEIPAFKDIAATQKALTKANDNVKNATTAAQLTKALQAQKAVIDGMSPGMATMIRNLQAFSTAYEIMAKKFEGPAFKIFSQALGIGLKILKDIYPIALHVADAISRLLSYINTQLDNKQWKAFFDYLSKNAGYFIETWGKVFFNFISGIANMIVAFDPLSKMVSGGFLEMSEKFRKWTEGLGKDKGFQNFVSFVKQNTPEMLKLLKSLFQLLAVIVPALLPVGTVALDIINKILAMVVALSKANPLVAGLGTAIGGMITFMGQWGAVLAVVLDPMTLLAAAVIGLIAWLVIGHNKTKQFTSMMRGLHELWKALIKTGKEVWNVVKGFMEELNKSHAAQNFQVGFKALFNVFKQLLPIIKPVVILIGLILIPLIEALAIAFRGIAQVISWVADAINPIIRGIAWIFQWLYDVLVGHSIIPDLIHAIIWWFEQPYKNVMAALQYLIGGIINAWNSAYKSVSDIVSSIVNRISSIFSGIGRAISNGYNDVHQGLTNIANMIMNIFSGAGDWLRGIGQDIINGLIHGIGDMIDPLKSTFSNITSLIPSWKGPAEKDRKLLTPAGHFLMDGLIGGIDDHTGHLKNKLTNISKMISDTPISADVNSAVNSYVNFKMPDNNDAQRNKDLADALASSIAETPLEITGEFRQRGSDLFAVVERQKPTAARRSGRGN